MTLFILNTEVQAGENKAREAFDPKYFETDNGYKALIATQQLVKDIRDLIKSLPDKRFKIMKVELFAIVTDDFKSKDGDFRIGRSISVFQYAQSSYQGVCQLDTKLKAVTEIMKPGV